MKAFTTLVAFALAAVVVATPNPIEKRQLAGLPTVVCLTSTSTISSITSILGELGVSSIVTCSASQNCTALPIIGTLLPIGVSIPRQVQGRVSYADGLQKTCE